MGSNEYFGIKSYQPTLIETKNVCVASVGLNHCIFVTCKIISLFFFIYLQFLKKKKNT